MSTTIRISVVFLLVFANAIFVAAEYALVTARRGRLVQRGVGRDPADQLDARGQALQDALAPVGAVAADDDPPAGEHPGEPLQQLDGQFRAGPALRLAGLCRPLALAFALPLVRPW